jgi:16S rRNA (guanine527-N7)-methyltransferase
MSSSRNISPDEALLAGMLDRLGLPISLSSPLLAHAEAVRRNADRLGLVSRGDLDSIVPRHTADSLVFAFARAPVQGESWADVGSGAGFPGIVLACCYPATSFLLVEPKKRRAGFLELVAADLGLENVRVQAGRFEQVEETFDVVTARALSSPAEALQSLAERVKAGGLAIVAAGPNEQLPPSATMFRLEDSVAVDSPGVLFMMSREA